MKAAFNPFHTATARPAQLLVNLLSVESKTTSDASAPIKGSPSPNVNILVSILPRTAQKSEITVGYTDGKTENIVIQLPEQPKSAANSQYPRVARKAQEAMTIQELVTKVDAWSRVLKQKDE